MSLLQRYTDAMSYIEDMRNRAADLMRSARIRETGLLSEFGIRYHDGNRVSGWTHDDLMDCYDTPAEAIEALDEQRSLAAVRSI